MGSQPGEKPRRTGNPLHFQAPLEVVYKYAAEQRNFRQLEGLFLEADTDGSGSMSLEEFNVALRKPWVQGLLAMLGIQPFQAEVVFKAMDKERQGELGIHLFITRLEELVCGSDSDEEPAKRELNVSLLRNRNRSREKPKKQHQRSGTPKKSSWSSALLNGQHQTEHSGLSNSASESAFWRHSVSMKALHPATAQTRGPQRVRLH